MSPATRAPGPDAAAMQRISEHGAKIAAGLLRITVAEYREHEARDEHWCPRCESWVPGSRFSASRGARRGYCILCRQASQTGLDIEARVALTPEGAATVSRADSALSEPAASCVQAVAAPSGHVYRTVDLLTPSDFDALTATSLHWLLPVGIVTRDGARRGEGAAS